MRCASHRRSISMPRSSHIFKVGNGALNTASMAYRHCRPPRDSLMHCAVLFVQQKERFEKGGGGIQFTGDARRSGSHPRLATFASTSRNTQAGQSTTRRVAHLSRRFVCNVQALRGVCTGHGTRTIASTTSSTHLVHIIIRWTHKQYHHRTLTQ